MNKNKIKELLKDEEIRQYISALLDEKFEKELKDEEYKKQPTPHYLSEYGNYLVKTPITLSDINIAQLRAIARLIVLAKIGLLDPKIVNSLITQYLKLKISVRRIGREDLKFIAKYGSQKQETTIFTKQKTREDYI
jgi:hypothetical protein